MRTAPLQIYSSALIFAPSESIVRLMNNNNIPKYISGPLPETEPRWSACLHILEGHPRGTIESVAFSPNGALIASASGAAIQLWSTGTGSCKLVIKDSRLLFKSVAFSPDSTRMVSITRDNKIQLWSVDTGALEQTEILRQTEGTERKSVLVGVSDRPFALFSPNGKYVMSYCPGRIQLWSMGTGELRHSKVLSGIKNIEPGCISFSSNSELIVAVTRYGLISSWFVDTGTAKKTVQIPENGDHVVAISPDATLVATCQPLETSVQVWCADTGKLLLRFGDWKLGRNYWAFSPDSKLLAIARDHAIRSYRFVIALWSVKTGALQHTIEISNDPSFLVFSPDSTLLATRYLSSNMKIWSAHQSMKGGNSMYHGAARWPIFSPDGMFVISANGLDSDLQLWNATKGSLEHRLCPRWSHYDYYDPIKVGVIRISPDSRLIAVSTFKKKADDWRVCLWSAATGSLLQIVKGYHVAFSPDCRVIATAFKKKTGSGKNSYRRQTIQLWSSPGLLEHRRGGRNLAHSLLRGFKSQSALKLLRELETNSGPSGSKVASIAISCDSQLVASASQIGSMRLWSISDTSQKDFYGDAEPRNWFDAPMTFSPDSKLIAIGGRDSNDLLLMSTADFRPQMRLSGSAANKIIRHMQLLSLTTLI